MGQIVKRKKKGRPSKADLARRSSVQTPTRSTPPERRRSLRRRNVRYNNFIDYDDYLDDFEDFPDIIEENVEERQHHEQKRREKKLKLVVKLHDEDNNRTRPKARLLHEHRFATSEEEEEEEDGDDSERKPLKKRRVNNGGGDESEGEEEEREDESENEIVKEEDNDQEERSEGDRNTDVKGKEVASGTPTERGNGLSLPDKKLLELILSKLQKRDTYGVYAEPVDLEELPDYLDVIDHPMDFATVRKKLGNGSYATLEEFESDVFLICSNAMQYNGPETIYHKQAHAIQELAKKKFQKIRIDIEHTENEVKSEQKTKSNFSAKKPMKWPLNRNLQEPVGSDYLSAATLAAAGEAQNGSLVAHGGGCEGPVNSDALVDGNLYAVDNNLERVDDSLSGKGLLSRFGRKPSVVDENRRATYNVSRQPEVKSESIFSTFEGEVKQLVVVGLHAECSYARSLARFAANLGPIAWKVASKRIEQALPNGCKFGRGWVGEYEPPPTPVLLLEKHIQNDSILFPTFTYPQKSEASLRNRVPATEQPKFLSSEGKPSLFCPTSGPVSEEKSSMFPSPRTNCSPANPKSHQQDTPRSFATPTSQQQKPHSKSSAEVQNKVSTQVELNLPPANCQQDVDVIAGKRGQTNLDMAAPKSMDEPGTADVKQSRPPKMPGNCIVDFGGLPNGKASCNLLNNRMNSPPSGSIPHQMTRGPAFFPEGQDKRLTDPVEAMRKSAEKSHKEQIPSNQLSGVTPVKKALAPSVKTDSGNASVAAVHAWMSIGSGGFRPSVEIIAQSEGQISADSLYNPARQIHAQFPPFQGQFPRPAGFQFQPDMNNFPFQAFARHSGNGQVQNLPMVFPQLVSTDMSRLQMQSPWQAMSNHSQLKQKQENLPPDLNIGCQSPGSPVKQLSGEMVDSQQPDLALQL